MISGTYQTFLMLISGISQIYIKHILDILETFPRHISDIYQVYPGQLLGISQAYLGNTQRSKWLLTNAMISVEERQLIFKGVFLELALASRSL